MTLRYNTVAMRFGRLTPRLMVLGFGLLLGSCSGFSGFVADSWPHWAGGEPKDIPPRPGAPGYDEFIAHKPQDQNAAPAAGPAVQASPQAPSSGGSTPGHASVVAGGLY